jgi:hypothetical protein
VIGSLLVLGSLGMLGGSAVAFVTDEVVRDDDGYITSPNEDLATSGYALVSDPVDLHDVSGADSWFARELLGDVRLRVTSYDSGAELFVGIASTADVTAYLEGTDYAVVEDVSDGRTTYTRHAGGPPPVPPGGQDIWIASISGTGTQSLEWPVRDGRWTVVVMNTAATPGLDVEADIGATLPGLDNLAWVLAGIGVVGLVGGGVLVLAAVSRARRHPVSRALPPPMPMP